MATKVLSDRIPLFYYKMFVAILREYMSTNVWSPKLAEFSSAERELFTKFLSRFVTQDTGNHDP